jgi:VanZ family protein
MGAAVLRFLWRFRFSFLVAIIIFYVSIIRIPSPVKALLFPGADKVAHFLLFLIQSVAVMLEGVCRMRPSQCGFSVSFCLIFLLPALYGGLIELLQQYCFPPRTGEWLDFFSDLAGALLAFLIYSLFVRKEETT